MAKYEVTVEANTQNRPEQRASWTWRRLLRAAALTSIVVSGFAVLAFGQVESTSIVFAVAVGIGLLWLRRPGRGSVVYLGVVHLLIGLIVLVIFELLPELAYPASWKVFTATGGRLVTTLTALVAAVGALRGGPVGAAAPRAAAAIAGAALLAFSIIGIGARLGVSDDKRQPGDVVIEITSDTQFGPRELNLAAGRIAVYVENHDVHHGNFTIDEVVSLGIPAGSAQRATFDLAPGRYRYYSKLYPEDLNGIMVVS